jgi:hypothetical protein
MMLPSVSIATVPEQNTKPPATIPWEYIPGIGIGASLVSIAVLVDILADLEVVLNEAAAIGVE